MSRQVPADGFITASKLRGVSRPVNVFCCDG